MTYLPAFQGQLGRGVKVPLRSQGSRDCGPRTVQMGCDAQTDGVLVPSVKVIRDRMDKEGPQTTSVEDAERAIDGWRVPGRRPLRYRILRTIAEVKRAVSAGRYVHLCVSYRTFNRLAGRTGDPSFTGGHSVGVLGHRTSDDGDVLWRLHDPLDDRRRPGIPQGPRWVKAEHLERAMEDFAGGRGRCWAGSFSGGQER
jgi:hypothetical protein